MADFVKSQGHVRLYQAIGSFKPVAHRLSAWFQRLAGRRASDIELMQRISASKKHYHLKDDPWFLLEADRQGW